MSKRYSPEEIEAALANINDEESSDASENEVDKRMNKVQEVIEYINDKAIMKKYGLIEDDKEHETSSSKDVITSNEGAASSSATTSDEHKTSSDISDDSVVLNEHKESSDMSDDSTVLDEHKTSSDRNDDTVAPNEHKESLSATTSDEHKTSSDNSNNTIALDEHEISLDMSDDDTAHKTSERSDDATELNERETSSTKNPTTSDEHNTSSDRSDDAVTSNEHKASLSATTYDEHKKSSSESTTLSNSIFTQEEEKKIEERKEQIEHDISKQVEELEKVEIDIDYSSYIPSPGVYNAFLLDKIKIPYTFKSQEFRADSFVQAITIFDEYESFSTPQVKLLHTIPEKVISLKNLNTIFGYQFIDTTKFTSSRLHLNDLNKVLQGFFESRNAFVSINLEYKLIQCFLQKMMILLCTYEELPFLGANNVGPNVQYKSLIDSDFEVLNVINKGSKIHQSWIQLVSALFDTTSKMMVFKFKSYMDLKNKFNAAFDPTAKGSYLLEQLLGCTLKTCLQSISLTYLYAVRTVYVFCRLLSIYYQERRYAGRTKEQMVLDIYHMALVSVSLYENAWAVISQCAKTFPSVKGGKELKRETKEYLNSHLLSSGVYYVLKMFEKSAPALANQF